jgi:hypothetical protein
MKRTFLWINTVAAAIVVVGVFVQVYLIASAFTGAGEDAIDAHGFVGGVIVHASELIVFLSALGAYWSRWGRVGLGFGLFLLGTVQIFLSPPDEDPASGWIHGLHGLGALFVAVLAAVIFEQGRRELRPSGAAASAAPPQPLP